MYKDFFDGNLGSHQKTIIMKISKKDLRISKKTLFSFRSKLNNSHNGTNPFTYTSDPTVSTIITVNTTHP